MKKIFILFVLSSFIIFPVFATAPSETSGISADKVKSNMIFRPDTISILGQNHSYSVTFRGNGEAIVSLRVILSNLDETPISTVSLRVPRINPQDINVYQVIKEPICVRYNEQIQLQKSESTSQSLIYPDPSPIPLICEEYQEPDFYQYYYGNNSYKKAKYELKGDEIEITLPDLIESNKNGSYILYYRAIGYAKKTLFSAYDFTFETLKINDKISTLQVGINTDSDLVLKDGNSKVSYRLNENTFDKIQSAAEGESIRSAQLDNFYQQTGQGTIVKTATNLQTLDSYIVKGSYADSNLRLYAKEILIIVIVILLFLTIVFCLFRWIIKQLKKNQNGDLTKESSSVKSDSLTSILLIFGLSFTTSFFILVYTLCLFAANQYLDYTGLYQYKMLFFIFFLLISIGVYGFLLFGPAIFIGIKKGVGSGFLSLFLTIIWLMFYLVFIFIIMFVFLRNSNYPPYPIPLMEKSTISK